MPVKLGKKVATLEGVCAVEEAEPLLAWLREHPRGRVNLARLEHPHTAVLQVLMALGPAVSAPPKDRELAAWLLPAMGAGEREEAAAP